MNEFCKTITVLLNKHGFYSVRYWQLLLNAGCRLREVKSIHALYLRHRIDKLSSSSSSCEFFTPGLVDGFSLVSPQVPRTLLRILADLSNVTISMVTVYSSISNFSMSLDKTFETVLSAPLQMVLHSPSFSIVIIIIIIIIAIITLPPWSFVEQVLLVVYQWSQNESKSPKISRVFLADFNRAVVWIVSILFLIYSFRSIFSGFLENIPRAPKTITIPGIGIYCKVVNELTRVK